MQETYNEDEIRIQTLALEGRITWAMKKMKQHPMKYLNGASPMHRLSAMRLMNGVRG